MEKSIDSVLALPHNHDPNLPEEIAESAALEAWKSGTIDSLDQFEACLREIGSRVYCVAVPLYTYGDFPTWYPAGRDDDPKYTLEIAMNKNDATGMLQEQGLTEAENMSRLANTGLLLTSL